MQCNTYIGIKHIFKYGIDQVRPRLYLNTNLIFYYHGIYLNHAYYLINFDKPIPNSFVYYLSSYTWTELSFELGDLYEKLACNKPFTNGWLQNMILKIICCYSKKYNI